MKKLGVLEHAVADVRVADVDHEEHGQPPYQAVVPRVLGEFGCDSVLA